MRRERAPPALAAPATAAAAPAADGGEGTRPEGSRPQPAAPPAPPPGAPRAPSGRGPPRAPGLRAEIADALQRVHETDPVRVARAVGVLERDLPGHHPAGDHGRLKTRPLFVGEDDERDGMAGADPMVVQRADRLEAAEDAELAVVLAAGRHGVHV